MRALHLAALLGQAALIALLLPRGPIGWLAAAALAIPLPWMWRRSRHAFAANSLLLPFYVGFFVAFRGDPGFLLLALLSAATFVAGILYVRGSGRGPRRPDRGSDA